MRRRRHHSRAAAAGSAHNTAQTQWFPLAAARRTVGDGGDAAARGGGVSNGQVLGGLVACAAMQWVGNAIGGQCNSWAGRLHVMAGSMCVLVGFGHCLDVCLGAIWAGPPAARRRPLVSGPCGGGGRGAPAGAARRNVGCCGTRASCLPVYLLVIRHPPTPKKLAHFWSRPSLTG